MTSTFDWLTTTQLDSPEATTQVRVHDLGARAFLLARLGYSAERAEARLRGNLAWEFEGLGAPRITKQVAAIVAEAYRKAGAAAPPAKKPRKKKR